MEPASGVFDVTVAPGANVQEAVDACPPGGCVLLQPGTHEGPLELSAEEVHVFGRGLATLRAAVDDVLECCVAKATVDGLIIRREAVVAADDNPGRCGVVICAGALRLQACDVTSAEYAGIFIGGDGTDPVITGCTCVGLGVWADCRACVFGGLCDPISP